MDRPIVAVKQGKLQGILQENVLGSHYFAFRGIPFAAPPIGKLRFQDPEPPASWDNIRDASKEGNMSPQIQDPFVQMIGDEDCLYLNVYVPRSIYETTRNPVIIWIHGGGFVLGSSNDSSQRYDYLLAKEVIVVSISYRLGALGFLNLGHEVASGNQGIKDQIAALKWVKENIEVFGGNPDNITLYGHSAGAVSAHLLMLSTLSKGLFHKAILQSGLGTVGWATKRAEKEMTSFKLASILGNDSKDPEEIVEFLRTIPVAEIIKAQDQLFSPQSMHYINMPFKPTIDDRARNPFLPYSVSELVHDDNDIPIIIGHNTHEYLLMLDDSSEDTLKTIYEELPNHVKKLRDLEDPIKINRITERIKKWYFNGKSCTENSVLPLIRCMTNLYLNIPILEFVDNRRKRKKALTYYYKFSYIGNEMTVTQHMGHQWTTGTSHYDEASYLFYIPSCKVNDPKPPITGTRDRKIMEALTSMWANFAKTGNPTPVIDQNVTTTWLPATPDDFNCLEINDALQCSKITDWTNIFHE